MRNPFKMFGSYVGLFLGLVGAYFSFAIIFYFSEIGKFNVFLLGIPMLIAFLGFLIGWLLHLFFRNLKR